MSKKKPVEEGFKSHDDVEDHVMDLYMDAKFTEILEFAKKYKVPKFWKKLAEDALFELALIKVNEKALQRYVEFIGEACPLAIVTNSFEVYKDPRKFILVRITVDKKHVTEGGRVAEAISEMNTQLMDEFTGTTARMSFRIRVAGYDDEEDDFEEEYDHEEEDRYDPDECECAECICEAADKVDKERLTPKRYH